MSKRLPRLAKRKGLSEMVGALFILILLAVAFSFSLVMFNSFSGYQNAVNTRAQYNAQLPREQLSYSRVVFGASTSYNPSNSVTGNFGSNSPGSIYPVTNMNFTSDSSGWVFTRKYTLGTPLGLSGNFDPVSSVGSDSGPGAIYVDQTNNQGPSTRVQGIGNWTTQFTLTAGEVAALSVGTSSAAFSFGDIVTINSNPIHGFPNVAVYLQDAVSLKTATVSAPTTPSATAWNMNHCFNGGACGFASLAAQQSFFSGGSGTYNLILETQTGVVGQSGAPSEQKVYFDDVGIQLTLATYFQATLCPVFSITQNPLSIQDLTMSVTSSYTQPVTQTVYLWDYAQGTLTQVDLATIGNTATTRFIDLGGLVGGASEIQRFIQTSSASLTIAGCPNSPISTTAGSVVMKIYAVGTASFTGSLSADVLTAYYTDTSQFSMQLTNSGTETIHLVSLWVTGSAGATQFASTLGSPYNFSEWVAPGATVSVTVPYSWTSGQYSLELVSARGNIFSDSVTAA